MTLVSYDSSDHESSDDSCETEKKTTGDTTHNVQSSNHGDKVDSEFKMRIPRSAQMPNLTPNISVMKSQSGKILLTIPDLESLDSSDDSDDERESTSSTSKDQKKPATKINKTTSSGKHGLLSLLPPTRAFIVREGSKPIIPHQVVRKAAESQKKLESKQKPTPKPIAGESDELQNNEFNDTNDDETESGFFSFYTKEQEDPNAIASVRAAAAAAATTTSSSLLMHKTTDKAQFEVGSLITEPVEELSEINFSSSGSIKTPKVCIMDPSALKQDVKSKSIPVEENGDSDNEESTMWTEETFVPGPERKRACWNRPGIRANTLPVTEILSSTNTQVIEINQADLTEGAQLELMKSVTSDEAQYKPPPPDDDPGKLAHRKHQITWLAYQALEQETELQKRWSEARRNKASNRAKYGF